MMKGGNMFEIDLLQVNKCLCKCLRILVAFRRMAKEVSIDYPEFADLEREIREAAGYMQNAKTLLNKGEKVGFRCG